MSPTTANSAPVEGMSLAIKAQRSVAVFVYSHVPSAFGLFAPRIE
nr:hypothetical protein [Cupriavidus gilardii]